MKQEMKELLKQLRMKEQELLEKYPYDPDMSGETIEERDKAFRQMSEEYKTAGFAHTERVTIFDEDTMSTIPTPAWEHGSGELRVTFMYVEKDGLRISDVSDCKVKCGNGRTYTPYKVDETYLYVKEAEND